MSATTNTFDAVAYVDEAGALGRISRLCTEHDNDIGLFVAIVLRLDELAAATGAFSPAFERFKAAAPPNAKLHITDAYAAGNEEWARVADSVREDAYDIVRKLKIPVVFEAQRLREPRELRDMLAAGHAQGAEAVPSGVEVKPSASKQYVEQHLLEMLLEKFEVYAEDFELGTVDVRFDKVAEGLFETYKEKLDELRRVDDTTQKVTGYHRPTSTLRYRQFRMRIQGGSAAVTRVAGFTMAERYDPLVLLVDIIANSLNAYLSRLDVALPIDETSIGEWALGSAVWPKA